MAEERKVKVQKRAEDSHILMRGSVDGRALATIWHDGSALLFRFRHSSKGLKDVGLVTLQHFGVYMPNNIASHFRGIKFLAMQL
jgi:hypothetical protein